MQIIKEKVFYGFTAQIEWNTAARDAVFSERSLGFPLESAPETTVTQGKPDDGNIAMVILENDAWLLVREGGTAIDRDGKVYGCVSEEVESEPMPADDPLLIPFTLDDIDKEPPETFPISDTKLETLGWSPDLDHPIILQRIHGELQVVG